MVYEVYKKISRGRDPKTDKELFWKTGTLVETGNWNNERALIAQGYLGPPRKSQAEINKFLAKTKGKAATNADPVGVKRPPITKKAKELKAVPVNL